MYLFATASRLVRFPKEPTGTGGGHPTPEFLATRLPAGSWCGQG